MQNFLKLSESPGGVIRDGCGVPVEWTLLKTGDNELTRDGQPGVLRLDESDMRSILEHFERKKELIPVDSSHYLHDLATAKNLDEGEVLKLIPSGVAAMGFGSIRLDGEELRFRVQWTPDAHELLKSGIYKYFSPALRGLAKPPLRLTSVALENVPALNNLDALAASGEQKQKEPRMNKVKQALAKLLRRDALALASEEDAKKCEDEVAAGIEAKTKLLADLRKMLNLGDDVTDEMIVSSLQSMLAKAGGADALATELESANKELNEIKMAGEKQRHAALLAQGIRERKISPATQKYWETQDAARLAAYLPTAPVITPEGKINRETLLDGGGDIALSGEDEKAIRNLGLDREEYIKAKQKRTKK